MISPECYSVTTEYSNAALRLYPVFPATNRVALRNTTLPVGGGPDGRSPIYVPAGTKFDTAFYVLHRLPEIWGPDAEEFKPDRWDTFKPGAWEFVPFGGGARVCMGQQKAMMEASYVVARLLQEFGEIEGRDEREWKGKLELTAKNAHGCKVALWSVQALLFYLCKALRDHVNLACRIFFHRVLGIDSPKMFLQVSQLST